MKAHRTPPKRTHANLSQESESRILSHEEKHELIRAHADSRHKRPRGYGLGYYIAVAASCLVVATGWIMTLDRGLWHPAKAPDPAIQELTESAGRIKTEIDETAAKLDQARKQFKNATASTTR